MGSSSCGHESESAEKRSIAGKWRADNASRHAPADQNERGEEQLVLDGTNSIPWFQLDSDSVGPHQTEKPLHGTFCTSQIMREEWLATVRERIWLISARVGAPVVEGTKEYWVKRLLPDRKHTKEHEVGHSIPKRLWWHASAIMASGGGLRHASFSWTWY